MIFYRTIAPVRAISFDLDDTLYDNHPLMLTAEKKLLAYIQSNYSKCSHTDVGFWRTKKAKIIINNPSLKNDMGELRLRTLSLGFKECGYADAELTAAVNTCYEYFYFERSHFKVNETTCSLLSKLASKLPLVAITNGNVNLEQIGIADYFVACFKANLQQPMKPDPRMFDLTCQHVGISAKHILHVGDDLEKDIMGARAAGFSTAWYACNRAMHLQKENVHTLPDIKLKALQDLALLV